MTVLNVVRLGNPVLRHVSREIRPEEIGQPELQQLLDDMIETMRAMSGVGLAAPQIGRGLRAFVYEVDQNERYPGRGPIALHALLNPQIEIISDEKISDWEGCLSIPELRGLVPRFSEIRVTALDREGRPLEYRTDGFEARIIQHELDHLDGVVFLDRMNDMLSLTYTDEQQKPAEDRKG